MAGMLQVLTYLLSFYLVIKGVEVLQIAITSNRPSRVGPIIFGAVVLVACIIAAVSFTAMQDRQAMAMSHSPMQ